MSDECVLGCPETQVYITDKCGGRILGELSTMNSLSYGRTLDDTSESKADVQVGGSGNDLCCQTLGDTRSWIHSMSIFRGGKRAWFGPVTNVLYKRESTLVTARDVTAWLDRRKIHVTYNFVNERLDTVCRTLLEDAFSIDDPCNLIGSAIIDEMSTRITKEVIAGDGTAGDVFRDLARNYIDFTAIGTSIVIGEELTYGPFARLTDEHFLVDIELEERGLEAATHWTVVGSGVQGEAGEEDPFYGLLEGVAAEDSLTTAEDCVLSAEGRLDASNPAPLYVNVPDGARLSPTAPVCIEQLVPGTLIDMDVQGLCRKTAFRGRLTALQVTHAPDESVGVTIAPVGTTGTTAGGSQTRTPR